MANSSKNDVRKRIHTRIRRRVLGTLERPRLAVFRSLNHIYAQVIDDRKGATLVAASSLEKKAGVAVPTSTSEDMRARKCGSSAAASARRRVRVGLGGDDPRACWPCDVGHIYKNFVKAQ